MKQGISDVKMKNLNCWEFKKCWREPGGTKVHELGICPMAAEDRPADAGNRCWLVAGTMCKGEIQGTFAKKYEDCKVCDFYQKAMENECPYLSLRYLLFGQYLRLKGLVTIEDTIKARSMQLKQNRKIGELARGKAWLNDDKITEILAIQEETLKKFGEIAIEKGYLSEAQVDELLKVQKDEYLYFGEALVKLGVISESEMKKHLMIFNRLKFKDQQDKQ